jgi:hypothetical protein
VAVVILVSPVSRIAFDYADRVVPLRRHRIPSPSPVSVDAWLHSVGHDPGVRLSVEPALSDWVPSSSPGARTLRNASAVPVPSSATETPTSCLVSTNSSPL